MTIENDATQYVARLLLADDDPDDRFMAQEALDECRIANTLDTVEDGEELLEYLRGEGRYAENPPPKPDIILLDLNMPRMDGREALEHIKSDPALRRIPVIVLTTSQAESDIVSTYDLGVNSFITKPVTFDALVETMKALGEYWIQIVKLPEALRDRHAA